MGKVLIVGGGAAGMLAAVAAAEKGSEVHLFEKNEKTGKKLFLTGKGRCNLTNASDLQTVMQNIVTHRKFLYSALYTFSNVQMMELVERFGTPLKVERGNRVFPASDKSSDILKALGAAMSHYGVKVHLNRRVQGLIVEENPAAISGEGAQKKERTEKTAQKRRVTGICFPDGRRIYGDAVILATGGLSYPSTGSDGDGLRFAKELGIEVETPRPALVPLEIRETLCRELMGLSLKNVGVTVWKGKKKLYDGFGEMLFTHFGVSGPLILSASSVIGQELQQENLLLKIDLKPALDRERLDRRILRDLEEASGKQLKNALGGLLPGRMIPFVIERSGISPQQRVDEITREQRERLGSILKNFELTVTGTRGFEEAIITQGGVQVKEVNASTMESKKISRLFVAGEMIDVDALTGGYNLQIAWSTGYLAGISAAQAGSLDIS